MIPSALSSRLPAESVLLLPMAVGETDQVLVPGAKHRPDLVLHPGSSLLSSLALALLPGSRQVHRAARRGAAQVGKQEKGKVEVPAKAKGK